MKNLKKSMVLRITIVTFFSCKKDTMVDPVLNVSPNEVIFEPEGGEATVTIESSDKWTINNSAQIWLKTSQATGINNTTTINLTIGENNTGVSRTGILSVNASSGQARRVTVKQDAKIFPSYNTSPKTPDATGMSSSAVELAAKFTIGWNIGNTFEAPGGERGWGSPVITEDYIKYLKQQGFTAIRIPCAWDWYHVDDRTTAHINEDWLKRVKEVIGYCVNNDMYVLLNIHWDGGWLDENINLQKQDSVNAKQKAYWEQIATTMRDFDEHLMFASANEPPAKDAKQMAILTSYHQTFINAVRSTGGKNSYRVLVIQGPGTDIEKTNELMNTLPTDEINDKLMVEIHYYTPSQFCLLYNGDADWGKMYYYWGTGHHSTIEPERNAEWGEEDDVNKYFDMMKTKFVDKGIPVIMGEYGAYRRNGNSYLPKDLETHNNSVDYWITYVTSHALANGIKPFWWDTGGAIDRANYQVNDQRTIDALIAGSKQ